MSTTTHPENLRREMRVDARLHVALIRGRQAIPLETADVSFKGLFLRTHEPPQLRALVRLRVSLPTRAIEAHAMVVHVTTLDDTRDASRGSGAGLQFWGLSGPDRIAWDEYVRELIQVTRAAAKKAGEPSLEDASPISAIGDRPTPSGVRVAPGFGRLPKTSSENDR